MRSSQCVWSCGWLLVEVRLCSVSLPVFLGVVGQAPRVVGAVGHCHGELSGVRFEFESPSPFMYSVMMKSAYRDKIVRHGLSIAR